MLNKQNKQNINKVVRQLRDLNYVESHTGYYVKLYSDCFELWIKIDQKTKRSPEIVKDWYVKPLDSDNLIFRSYEELQGAIDTITEHVYLINNIEI